MAEPGETHVGDDERRATMRAASERFGAGRWDPERSGALGDRGDAAPERDAATEKRELWVTVASGALAVLLFLFFGIVLQAWSWCWVFFIIPGAVRVWYASAEVEAEERRGRPHS